MLGISPVNDPRQTQERAITARLLRVARLYRKAADRALAAYGLSEAQAIPVLHIARCGGGVRQHHLAEEMGIQGPSLVRLLDQLCAQGLVERRDDRQDRRAKTLHLTAAGEALAARVETVLQTWRGQLMAPLSDDALNDLLGALGALEKGLEALDKDMAD